ncbi:MAG: hypothetical protein Q9226_000584 [Calogaya cf. arnoldii]
MQLLTTPTRAEVDKAHSKGFPELTANIQAELRSMVLPGTELTTYPFPVSVLANWKDVIVKEHRYNSTVFSSLNTNGIAWVIVSESFLDGPSWTDESATLFNPVVLHYDTPKQYTNTFEVISAIHNDYQNSSSSYENHTTYDCLKAYLNPFDWRPRLLMMISHNETTMVNDSTYLSWGIESAAHDSRAHYLCDDDPTTAKQCNTLPRLTPATIGPVTIKEKNIDYCLYKPIDSSAAQAKKCHLQGSPQILLGTFPVPKDRD